MFDMASYYSRELLLIRQSLGCSEDVGTAIDAELALRESKPERDLPDDMVKPVNRARARVSRTIA